MPRWHFSTGCYVTVYRVVPLKEEPPVGVKTTWIGNVVLIAFETSVAPSETFVGKLLTVTVGIVMPVIVVPAGMPVPVMGMPANRCVGAGETLVMVALFLLVVPVKVVVGWATTLLRS